MSKLLKYSLVSFFILLVATVFSFTQLNDRYFQSKTIDLTLKNSKQSKLTSCKNLKSLSVSIDHEGEIPEENNAVVKLIASFRPLTFTADTIRYSWNLPADVEVVSGDRKGSFSEISPDQILNATLEVRGFSKKDFKQITLTAKLQKNGTDLQGASAIISSDPTKTWEHYGLQMSDLQK